VQKLHSTTTVSSTVKACQTSLQLMCRVYRIAFFLARLTHKLWSELLNFFERRPRATATASYLRVNESYMTGKADSAKHGEKLVICSGNKHVS